MALKNIFKKSNKKERTPKQEEKTKAVSQEKTENKNLPSANLKGNDFSFQILKGPHITEKASALSNINQYVFKVFNRANKIQVKKAVERLYDVKVDAVKMVKIPAKKRILGRFEGEKSGFKKTIVRLAKGYKIDLIPK